MISTFVDRGPELELLNMEWASSGARLIVLYGRRRIGKTRLLLEFIRDREGVFYIAADSAPKQQIEELKEKMAEYLRDPLLAQLEITDWNQLFEYFIKNISDKRVYLVIDEFSYMIRSDKTILSTLQRLWDLKFLDTNIFVVLSGPLLGLMSEKVLSHSSPLYGRRSRDILLDKLSFSFTGDFSRMNFEDRAKLYMTIGGVPEYLLKASEYETFTDFIELEFFRKDGYFYREPYFIISQEFKELKTYFSILNAIAYGSTRPGEIANSVGIDARKIYPYLDNLIRLGFVERTVPIVSSGKAGIYTIKDNLFDFWFNFVHRHRERMERGVFILRNDELSGYLGKRFEIFVRDDLFKYIPLSNRFDRIGKWWHRDIEIDLVALNEKSREILFIECKWKDMSPRDAKRELGKLEEKSEHVLWDSDRKDFG
ncbi:ATPase, partial [Methanosarcinales archaeon ex4484_138]